MIIRACGEMTRRVPRNAAACTHPARSTNAGRPLQAARAQRASALDTTIHRMDRTFMLIGVVAAFIGVGFGAFGAHTLRGRTSPEMLAVFETGVRYQMYHALAILITALALSRLDAPLIRWAGWLFTAGIVIFSGSLYALVLTGTSSLGAITPFGGIAFLAGWACLAIAALL